MRLPQLTFGKVLAGTAVVLLATTGTAYAANTVGSSDIINGSIQSIDIKNGTIKSEDILNGTIRGVDILDGTLVSGDILNDTIRSVDVRDETLTSADVLNDTLTADDLAANSVGSSEIQTDAVQATEIADNSIDSGEIVDGSLTAADLSVDSVRASELGTITQRSAVSANIPPGGNGSITATCLAGEQVVSGGNDGFFDVFVVASRQSGNGWAVFAHNDSAGNRTVTAHAYCLAP